MFASIRRYAGDTALADQLMEHEDEVRKLISGVPGYCAYYLVRGEDATTSITICDDRRGADESTRIAAGWGPSARATPITGRQVRRSRTTSPVIPASTTRRRFPASPTIASRSIRVA